MVATLQRLLVRTTCRLLPLELIVPLISRTPLLRAGLQGAYQRSIRNDRELQRLIAQPARRLSAPRSLRAMSVGMALRPPQMTAPSCWSVCATDAMGLQCCCCGDAKIAWSLWSSVKASSSNTRGWS